MNRLRRLLCPLLGHDWHVVYAADPHAVTGVACSRCGAVPEWSE